MTRTKKEDILVPVLEKYYPDESFFVNEEEFYSRFEKNVIREEALSLSKPFGIAIIITNIYANNKTKDLLNSLESSKDFEKTEYEGISEIDNTLFDKEADFSFDRQVFRCNERIEIELDAKRSQYFSLFISIAYTKLDHHIISFIFSTWNGTHSHIDGENERLCFEKSYACFSNEEIIKLINNKFWRSSQKGKIKDVNPFREALIKQDSNAYEFVNINKNTFVGINLWRYEWETKFDNNRLDVTKYIKDNPYFFYSLLTLDIDIFRRNFKNIMDYLGWGFSASRVHCGLFSRNVYISITLKPLRRRYDFIGHDGTEFRLWEIIALQNCLLERVYRSYQNCIADESRKTAELGKLIGELDKVYDFNAFIQKKGKGEIWIKFNRYLQDYIGISSYYELYESRHKRMQEIEDKKRDEEDKAKSNRIAKSNLILSAFIFVTIFLSIIAIFFNNYKIHLNSINFSVDTCSPGEPLAFGIASFFLALLTSIIFIYIFYKLFRHYRLID